MVTELKVKVLSAADAQTLRANYGDDLTDSKALLSDKQTKSQGAELTATSQEISALQSKDNLSKEDQNNLTTLRDKQASLQDLLKHVALEDVSKNISQSKLDSQRGQAEGIQENYDEGVSYAMLCMENSHNSKVYRRNY